MALGTASGGREPKRRRPGHQRAYGQAQDVKEAPSKGASFSSAWVGIDGFTNSALIQTGTEQDYYNGSAHYSAWWTTSELGYAAQTIQGDVVQAGDQMSAEISETGPGTWKITISDAPAGWSYTQIDVSHAGPGASAE